MPRRVAAPVVWGAAKRPVDLAAAWGLAKVLPEGRRRHDGDLRPNATEALHEAPEVPLEVFGRRLPLRWLPPGLCNNVLLYKHLVNQSFWAAQGHGVHGPDQDAHKRRAVLEELGPTLLEMPGRTPGATCVHDVEVWVARGHRLHPGGARGSRWSLRDAVAHKEEYGPIVVFHRLLAHRLALARLGTEALGARTLR